MNSASMHIIKNKRTFIALKVRMDDNADNLLKSIRNALQPENILWNKPENFHVTLWFIGDTSPEMLIPVMKALDLIAEKTSPFHFYISGIGVFRTISHPRVLWLGHKNAKGLYDLKAKIDDTLVTIPRAEAKEKFKPHLTIARMKKINDLKNLEEILKLYENQDFLKVNVEEIIFYESIITHEGPYYEILSVHPLKKTN